MRSQFLLFRPLFFSVKAICFSSLVFCSLLILRVESLTNNLDRHSGARPFSDLYIAVLGLLLII